MAIAKQNTRRGKRVKVTFSVPAEWLGHDVAVVGDFNDWDPTANPLRKKGGTLIAIVELQPGQRYVFRYVDSRGRWFDDPAADEMEPNGLGGSNGVIDLHHKA